MELLYIWIDDYKKIRKQGFNLSSKFQFEYKGKNLIDIKLNQKAVNEGFFSKGKMTTIRKINGDDYNILHRSTHHSMSNVTAIVGENGSGKSSFIDFIKYELTLSEPWNEKNGFGQREWLSNLRKNFIIFRHGEETLLAKSNNEKAEFFKIHLPNDTKIINLNITTLKKVEFTWKGNNFNRVLPATTVFYSNFFDGKIEYEQKGLINISTNFLLLKDKERYELRNTWGRKMQYESVEVNRIDAHKIKEIERQINFLCESNSYPRNKQSEERLTFLPENLYITVSKVDRSKIPVLIENTFNVDKAKRQELHEIINSFTKPFKQAKANALTASELFRMEFKETLFYRGIRHAFKSSAPLKYLINFFSNLTEEDWLSKADSFIEKTYTRKNLGSYHSRLLAYLENQEMGIFSASLNNENSFFEQEPSIIIDTKLLQQGDEKFNTFFSNYIFFSGQWGHFLDFSWRNMSSGELSLFNLFSRFNSIKGSSARGHYPSYFGYWPDSVLFLCDEGETGFHPKWQKEYLNFLLNLLPKKRFVSSQEEKSENGIQIILTTHSPFILSNLPKDNIIFLEKDSEGFCKVVDGLHEKKQTFGANIHTLLTDSFFMDGLVGDFAQEKIDEVIDFLNGDTQNANLNIEYAEKVINMIGEPILKRHLQYQLNLKRKSKADKNEEEIKELKQKIETLEKALKDNISNKKN